MNKTIYKCQNCKTIVSKKREPCPKCGCETRDVFVTIAEQITLHDQVSGKIKGISDKKPKLEFKKGKDFYRKSKQWNDLDRIIDRSNNKYKEIIKDQDGKTIKSVDEPLTDHQGYGSAKYRK